jgi:hypothetical protein
MRPAIPRSRPAIWFGVVALGAYLAGSFISANLTPLARRPLLDGFSSLPPYRWVSPPPQLANGNESPRPKTAVLHLGPDGSPAQVVSSPDLQFSLVLAKGAFPPAAGQTSAEVTVTPMDPKTLGPAPAGLLITGNAYRLQATYEPGGTAVTALSHPSDLALVYPASATSGLHGPSHDVLTSVDGRAWRRLTTTDAPAAELATTTMSNLGYFVVAQSRSTLAAPAASSRLPLLLIIAVAWLLVLLGIYLIVRWRSLNAAREFDGDERRRRRR